MLLPVALRVLLHLLGCCQSTALLQNAFATQRALVYKVKKNTEVWGNRERERLYVSLSWGKNCSCRMSPVVLAIRSAPSIAVL